jgi:hypothetical protein
MIRAILRHPDGFKIVVMGLDEEHMECLRQDRAVRLDLQDINPFGPKDTTMPEMAVVVAFNNGNMNKLLTDMSEGMDLEIWEY